MKREGEREREREGGREEKEETNVESCHPSKKFYSNNVDATPSLSLTLSLSLSASRIST